MKFKEFLALLNANKDCELVFEYRPNSLVGANYHITEVKQVNISSVDCGGQEDAWQETIIQLWESPSEIGKTEYMTVQKALSILAVVDKKQALRLDDQVKVEYSNAHFHTAVLYVSHASEVSGRLVVSLQTEDTRCKAPELCTPPKLKVKLGEKAEACCSPDSGCC